MVCKTGDYCQVFSREKTVRTRKKVILKSKEICCTTNKPPFFFLLYLHYTVNTSFSLPYLTHAERMTKTHHPMFVNNNHISIAKVNILYSLHNILLLMWDKSCYGSASRKRLVHSSMSALRRRCIYNCTTTT